MLSQECASGHWSLYCYSSETCWDTTSNCGLGHVCCSEYSKDVQVVKTLVPNSEVKCQFVLDMAYQGTYLVAIANHRTQIYLTRTRRSGSLMPYQPTISGRLVGSQDWNRCHWWHLTQGT